MKTNLSNKPELDQEVVAVCTRCGRNKLTTFRKLKNKWAVCICGSSMKVKVKNGAVSTVHTSDRMGDA